MWTFMVADRRAGVIPIVSPNTDEAYSVGPHGDWVPTVDVEALLRLTRMVCCKGSSGVLISIKPLAEGRPTADQMTKKPARAPKLKARLETEEPEPSEVEVESPILDWPWRKVKPQEELEEVE
jgi:hypothetical protein